MYFCRVAPLFRAIVFVVDSAIFQKEVRDVAEFLYTLLSDTVISRNAPALLVACNKQGEKAFTCYIVEFILMCYVCNNVSISL